MATNQELSIEIIGKTATVPANATVQAILEERRDIGKMDTHHCTPMQIR